jgi:hypothetical protein
MKDARRYAMNEGVKCTEGSTRLLVKTLSFGGRARRSREAYFPERSDVRMSLPCDGALLNGSFNYSMSKFGSLRVGAVLGKRRVSRSHSMIDCRRFLQGLLATAALFASVAHAQSGTTGPVATVGGSLQFVQEGSAYVAQIDGQPFDRVNGSRLRHFDDTSGPHEAVARMLVEEGNGLVLYDFRRKPPAVERIGRRLRIDSVYWQRDEAVLRTGEGWYRFQRGTLTKLTSSKTIYH